MDLALQGELADAVLLHPLHFLCAIPFKETSVSKFSLMRSLRGLILSHILPLTCCKSLSKPFHFYVPQFFHTILPYLFRSMVPTLPTLPFHTDPVVVPLQHAHTYSPHVPQDMLRSSSAFQEGS